MINVEKHTNARAAYLFENVEKGSGIRHKIIFAVGRVERLDNEIYPFLFGIGLDRKKTFQNVFLLLFL